MKKGWYYCKQCRCEVLPDVIHKEGNNLCMYCPQCSLYMGNMPHKDHQDYLDACDEHVTPFDTFFD